MVGLTGTGMVLEDNGSDDLTISGTGTVTFTFKSLRNQLQRNCQDPADRSDLQRFEQFWDCHGQRNQCPDHLCASLPVGGTVSGLLGSGLTLQDNAGDDLVVNGTGTVNFTFATPLLAGAAYAVTILKQPVSPGQTCVVSNASGTISGSVASVQISCPYQSSRWVVPSRGW